MTTNFKTLDVKRQNTIIKKLKTFEYDFVFDGEELKNGVLEYWFNDLTTTTVSGDENKKTVTTPISFSISADDTIGKTFNFTFIIDISLDELKSLPNKPVDITSKVIDGEIIFTNPYESGWEFKDIIQNIYGFIPSFWVQKESDTKYIFKAQYSDLFLWFIIDFE